MSSKSVTFTYLDELYAHRLAWDLYMALERGRMDRARKLLERIMGKGISQAADIYLDAWRTPQALAELRLELEKSQGRRPALD